MSDPVGLVLFQEKSDGEIGGDWALGRESWALGIPWSFEALYQEFFSKICGIL